MDTKQIIIFILIIAFYVFNLIRKAKMKANDRPTPHPQNPFKENYKNSSKDENEKPQYSYYENYENDLDQQMLKNQNFFAESLETGTLETETLETSKPTKNKTISTKNNVQIVENEEYNTIDINLEQDELRKGIIYAEILKRKYN
jgi:hypothetical protein